MHFFLSNQTEYVYLHRIMLFLIKKENMKNESKLFYLLRICFIFFYYIHSLYPCLPYGRTLLGDRESCRQKDAIWSVRFIRSK